MWIGNKILPANRERYIAKAESHIKLLQKYESAPEAYTTINQNEEPAEFWDFWKIKFEDRYLENKEWDFWFVDLATHVRYTEEFFGSKKTYRKMLLVQPFMKMSLMTLLL